MAESTPASPQEPGVSQNHAGNPAYEERLARSCPYVDCPCTRELCRKWIRVDVMAPSQVAGVMKQLYYYQCQEDTVADFVMAAHGAINQMPMILMQLMKRGDGHQRLIPGG